MLDSARRRFTVFEGLSDDALSDIHGRMRTRQFAAREVICRAGDPGDSLFVVESGLAHVLIPPADGVSAADATVERLRRGDVFGEMALLSGEPRSATVVAVLPTTVLELDRTPFATVAARYPVLVANLSRILSLRLRRATLARARGFQRGEVVGLLVDPLGAAWVAPILAAAAAASPRGVVGFDFTGTVPVGPLVREFDSPSVPRALALLDDILPRHGTIVVVVELGSEQEPALVEQTDRVIVLSSRDGTARMGDQLGDINVPYEVVLLGDKPADDAPAIAGGRVVRVCSAEPTDRDVGWLGRHLSRTKLGLALGAGGAKGYAHVATVQVLQDAGYAIDVVAGSSIGALVGAWLALGQDGATIEATMRNAFSPETVAAMFKLSLTGLSSGLDAMVAICRDTTDDYTFADLQAPFAAMTIDLDVREPFPITTGPLWEALLAATALPGMFLPYEWNGHRLVDGLCLVPVPTETARALGADVVLSVNLMNRATLPAWPGASVPDPAPARSTVRMLDTLLESLDLAQLDASVRHAALADVVVTPRFGPSTWREFERADLFLAAGRVAAEEQLASLRSLALPQAVT